MPGMTCCILPGFCLNPGVKTTEVQPLYLPGLVRDWDLGKEKRTKVFIYCSKHWWEDKREARAPGSENDSQETGNSSSVTNHITPCQPPVSCVRYEGTRTFLSSASIVCALLSHPPSWKTSSWLCSPGLDFSEIHTAARSHSQININYMGVLFSLCQWDKPKRITSGRLHFGLVSETQPMVIWFHCVENRTEYHSGRTLLPLVIVDRERGESRVLRKGFLILLLLSIEWVHPH